MLRWRLREALKEGGRAGGEARLAVQGVRGAAASAGAGSVAFLPVRGESLWSSKLVLPFWGCPKSTFPLP